MKKSILLIFVLTLLCLSADCCAEEGKGQVEIATDIEDALIYVNGQKKASAGDGYTVIRLPEGDYRISVKKISADGQWLFFGTKHIFVGVDTSIKMTINTQKISMSNISMIPEEEIRQMEAEPSPPGKMVSDAGDNILVEKAVPGLELVLIQPGKFTMGSPPDEPYRDDDEDQHEADIQKAFYMQTTEVTQKQWKAVMGENPSKFKKCGDDCPVENVSWEDIQKFIIKLNQMLTTDKYRLPTESEWEYACRAGSTTTFFYGNCLTSRHANFDNTNAINGCPDGSNENRTVPVASFAPNAFGLYDMHGNVWEWCQDLKTKYPSGSKNSSSDTSSGNYIITRGGSWFNEMWHCRSANRGRATPDYYSDNLGFRLVRAL